MTATSIRSKRRRIAVIGLLGLVLAAPAFGQPAAPPPTAPIRWRSHDLSIPYRWTGAKHATQEVLLFYSADAGRTWVRAGSAAPHVRSFRFRAPGDGAYWFAIRSYDALGRATPATPLGPEMRVVVDTAAPQIEQLNATTTDGQLSVQLTARDADGFPNQAVRLYAQPAGAPDWTPIVVTNTTPTAGGLQAAATWRPPADASGVTIRAVVTDRAGNAAERTATATLGATRPSLIAAAPGPSLRPSLPPSTDPFVVAARQTPMAPINPPAPQQSPSSTALQLTPPQQAAIPQRRARREPESTPWPSDTAAARPLKPAQPADALASRSPFRSAGLSTLGTPSDTGFGQPATATPARLVNSTRFEFDYELDNTGRWGVAKVELWGTENGGRSWRRFAIDADRRSPIHVTTPGEGRFGFRLVVEPVGGLDVPTPRPGDRPEAEIVVDLHAPSASITAAQQGAGYFADQMQIEWRVDDEHLVDAPIDLFYGSRPTGPWAPIAAGLDNTGRHAWRLQRHLPRQVYLRLETRDQAGNTAAAVTPEPITLEVPTAGGSLLGVRAQ